MKEEEIVGVCLNKVDFSDAAQNIPSFAEAVEGRNIFMNRILEFMDDLYEVSIILFH